MSTMEIKTVYEPELLGTAGTLLANEEFFESGTGLLIHADNAMAGYERFHRCPPKAVCRLPTDDAHV